MRTASTVFLVAAVLGVLWSAGCAPKGKFEPSESVLLTPPDTISMYSLAGRLGLTVTEHSPTMVAMRNNRNSVVLFAGPLGRAYVNGKPVPAPVGGIVRADGMLFIPISYEPAIRGQMRGPVAWPALPVPLPRPPPSPLPLLALRGGLVVIDPGHGGHDPGATSVRGDREKTIVLDVARHIADTLAGSGVDVRMTRNSDRFVELEDRADFANRLRADLFVSIHADHARNRAARGFTVYVSRLATRRSEMAADAIARRLGAAGVPSRGIKEANYRVLVATACPAALVELGYLSNRRDAASLGNPDYRQEIGHAIADGIVDYLQRD